MIETTVGPSSGGMECTISDQMQPPIGSTFARLTLEEHQVAHPPLVGDRIIDLYASVSDHMPQKVRELVQRGNVAIGEVGYKAPIVRSENIHGDWVIEVSSNLMQFVYAISRSLLGATRSSARVKIAKARNPTIARQELAKDIADDFRQWKREAFEGAGLTTPLRPLEPHRVAEAEHLATMGERFLLLRELARLMVAITPVKSTGAIAADLELTLDSLAATLLFTTTIDEKESVHAAYAGAVLAIRCVSCLGRIGCEVSASAPPVDTRFEVVETGLLDILNNHEAGFVVLSAKGAELDELLECVEHQLGGERIPSEQRPARLAGICFAMLARHANGSLDEKKLRACADAAVRDVPKDVLSEAHELLGLALKDEALQPPGVIAAIRVACKRLALELPVGRREIFELGRARSGSERTT